MNYTKSNAYDTHGGTGHRRHQDSAVVPTVWSADDANMVIWSLMKVLADAGVAGVDFSADVPGSYDRLSLAIQTLGTPVGQVAAFGVSAVPAGWLECNGAAVSRTTYARLFAAMGTVHGAGDGATTFNLPDLRGEFVRGWDHGRGVDAGRTFASSQTWATGAPRTTTPSRLMGDGSTTALAAGAANPSAVGFARPSVSGESVTTAGYDATGSGGEIDTVNVVSGDPETRPRNVALMYCIRT